MALFDKKIMSGGLLMIAVGVIVALIAGEAPAGHPNMTDEEVIDLMIREDESQALQLVYGILIGVGFLLVLVSFGTRRKSGSAKKIEKKPAE